MLIELAPPVSGESTALSRLRPPCAATELEDAVGGVEDDSGGEDADRLPVEALRAPRQVRDAGEQEDDVDRPLEHPLAELRAPVRRVDREVADQVDEQEDEPEADDDRRGARQPPVAEREPLERPHDEECDREHVGDADRPGDAPVHLLERDHEDGREEEEARDPHVSAPGGARRPASRRSARLSPMMSGTAVSIEISPASASSFRSCQRLRL